MLVPFLIALAISMTKGVHAQESFCFMELNAENFFDPIDDKDKSDTCDYTPPQVSLSQSGDNFIAIIRKGTYDIASYTFYINGVEQSGVSLDASGKIIGYTLKGTETSAKITIVDSAGYSISSELRLTPTISSDDDEDED